MPFKNVDFRSNEAPRIEQRHELVLIIDPSVCYVYKPLLNQVMAF
jgi:hypothetical protein